MGWRKAFLSLNMYIYGMEESILQISLSLKKKNSERGKSYMPMTTSARISLKRAERFRLIADVKFVS